MDARIISVLLIEDHPTDAENVTKELKQDHRFKFDVKWVRSLREAMDVLEKQSYPIALLDLTLPDGTDLGALSKLKTAFPEIATIILTARDDDELASKTISMGAHDYLIKGKFDRAALVRSIRYSLDRARTERALRESENRFRRLIETSKDIVLVYDRDGRILDVNRQALDALGIPPDTLLSMSIFDLDLQHTEEAFKKLLEKLETSPSVRESEYRRGDGTHFPVECHISLIETGGEKLVVSIVRDLSNQKSLEQKFETQKGKAIYAAKMAALGEMSGEVASEITNPLSIVRGVSKMILDRIEKSSAPEKREWVDGLNKVIKHVDRITHLIAGMRTYSDEVKKDFEKESHVESIIGNTVALCAEKFRTTGIELKLDNKAKDALLYCRPLQITQALMNLLNNAYDSIQGRKDRWIKIQVRQERDRVKIAVIDSGPPISEVISKQMFEPFFTTKEEGKGTGFGLGIASNFIENNRGVLSYETIDNHPSFVVSLPLLKQKD